ncbi:MAG: alpha/beta hydrolase, partial [Reyranellales bacterium]
VLVIDYRLAPEHPFPAPVEDAAKAWRWLLQQGLDASRLAIAGDSAGGGLTIATLVNLRDQKLGLPACAVAISPWVDLEGQGNSMAARAAQDPMVQKDGLLWMAGMYLGGKNAKTPLAAPLHADLKGLPPILVQVGTAETLLDDSTRIAEKLHAAGVAVRLAIWPNMLHVFPLFAPILSEGRDGCTEIGAFIRSRTA